MKQTKPYIPNRALLISSFVLGALCLLAAPRVYAERGKPPLFKVIAFRPVVVEPVLIEGTPGRPDQEATVRKLSGVATKQLRRILVRAHVAGVVEEDMAASLEAVTITSPIRVTAALRLPVSLPPELRGWNASQRKGRFATVVLTVQNADTGAVLAKGEGTCDWKDALWTTGKSRRSRPVDDVLEHFARKTMERATWDTARNASRPSTEVKTP